MFLSRTIKALAILAGLYSFNAHAGQKLFFKQATVDTNSVQSMSFLRDSVQTQYQVVQFKNVITASQKQSLESMGAKIIRYIPDDAYLVQVSNRVRMNLGRMDGVQSILPYAPALKISPSFGVIDHLSQERVEKVLVTTFNDEATQKLKKLFSDKVAVKFAQGKSFGFLGKHKHVVEISKIDGVEWVEPYPEFQFQNFEIAAELLDSVSRKDVNSLDGFESGTRVMNFEAAWNRGFTGRDQLVGFADTGLDSGNTMSIHQDFQGQVSKGYAYALFSFSWNDPMGHGTHVAGSIAGNGRASNGQLQGGAYEAQLIAGGMWSQLLNNMMPPQDISKMFLDAYNDGARIHTNSWGSPRNPGAYDQFAQTVDQFMWDYPEMLIMFAAGNSGTDANNNGRVDEDSIGSPATAKNVMSVGASENLVSDGGIQRKVGDLKKQDGSPLFSAEPIKSDYLSNNVNGIAAFSSRGPTDDRRMKPDVVAPGANILSVRSQVEGASELWGAMDANYSWSGGTSMSTPLVAGGVAVVRQYLAERGMRNPSAALMKGLMMHTAFDMYPGQFGENGKASGQEMLATRPNPHQGFGRVDMDAATTVYERSFISEGAISQGGTMTLNPQLTGSDFKITLIYTDAPGAASSSRALVNNLDIRVLEGGVEIARGTNNIDNHEYIEVGGLTGELSLEVIAQNVPTTRPDGSLPFAVIVTPM